MFGKTKAKQGLKRGQQLNRFKRDLRFLPKRQQIRIRAMFDAVAATGVADRDEARAVRGLLRENKKAFGLKDRHLQRLDTVLDRHYRKAHYPLGLAKTNVQKPRQSIVANDDILSEKDKTV